MLFVNTAALTMVVYECKKVTGKQHGEELTVSARGKPKVNYYEKARAQLKLSAKIRGSHLDYAITVERTVDGIISKLLCPLPVTQRRTPEQTQRFNVTYSFLTKRDLRSKIDLLDESLRLLEPGLPESTRKWIHDQLHEMRKFRNGIAHSRLDLTGKWLKKSCNDRIKLISYSGGKASSQQITMKEVERKIGGLWRLYLTLFIIEPLVGNGYTPSAWRNCLRAVAPARVSRASRAKSR